MKTIDLICETLYEYESLLNILQFNKIKVKNVYIKTDLNEKRVYGVVFGV